MNIFTKSKIKKSLDSKVETKEIRSYQLTENKLHIQKSKRCKHTIDMTGVPDHILVRLLQKRIPDPGIQNTGDFFKKEIRDLKIKNLIM
jgi:hypothetical protein